MIDPKEQAALVYSGDFTPQPIRRSAFVAGAKFEREQIIEFINRLVKVEEESEPKGPTELAMSSYAIGELKGILHVLEQRNGS